jgi:DNA-binding response OmpR family regulator
MSRSHPVLILIENDPAIAHQTEWSLSAAGFSVIATADGEDGLRIIERGRHRIDVVLAEAALPGIGGHEISEVLAEHLPGLPVVILSRLPARAATSESGSARFLPAAVDPRNPELLLRRVRIALERGRERPSRTAAPGSLKRVDLISLARAARARRPPPCCPGCGSSRVASVLYGSERMDQLAAVASGRVVLGGAWRPVGAPSWQCRDCDRRWSD